MNESFTYFIWFIFSNFVNAQKIFSIEEKTACFLREVGLFTNVDTPFHVYSLASAINLKEKSQYIFTDTILFYRKRERDFEEIRIFQFL